jgi:hypothetical protein
VADAPIALPAQAFSLDRSSSYAFDLPTAALPAGEYLLSVDGSLGSRRDRRTVRFSIAPR